MGDKIGPPRSICCRDNASTLMLLPRELLKQTAQKTVRL
jgi:hypothetical protein